MPSLASIVFTLTAGEETTLPRQPARILHAAFLRWLERDHPELVVKLHDANYARPYTLSELQGDFDRNGSRLLLRKGQSGWFRLTGMDEFFVQCVQDAAAHQQQGPQPDDPRLEPGPVLQQPSEHADAATSSFEEIAAAVQRLSQAQRLPYETTLRFQSPTCFIENKQSLPLPIPRYVFGNLANKWQVASPFALPVEDLQHFVESIHLAFARVETRLVDLGKYKRIGFVGEARFALHPALPEIYRQALHLLAKLAYFCGVGSHTTMGMGQTVALPLRQMK